MNVAPKFTEEDKMEAVRRLTEGWSAQSVANELGTHATVIYGWKKHYGNTVLNQIRKERKEPKAIEMIDVTPKTKDKAKYAKISEEDQIEATRLYLAGHTLKQVASLLGCAASSVSNYVTKHRAFVMANPQQKHTGSRPAASLSPPAPTPVIQPKAPEPAKILPVIVKEEIKEFQVPLEPVKKDRVRELEQEVSELKELVLNQLLEITKLKKAKS